MNRFDDEESDILGYPLSAYIPDDWTPKMGMNDFAYRTPEPTSKTKIVGNKIPSRKIISLAKKTGSDSRKIHDVNNHQQE